jgi:hypothetical protein
MQFAMVLVSDCSTAAVEVKIMRVVLLLMLCLLLSCAASARSLASGDVLPQLKNYQSINEITALKAPANGEFSFIVLGDNRSGDSVFSSLVRQINSYTASHRGAARPVFVLHTGDIVNGGTSSQWNSFAKLRAALQLPMVYVPGNHEIADATGPVNYQQVVGRTEWAFDFAGCRFIGLDNASGRFSANSVAFLRQQLNLAAAKHQAKISAGGAWYDAFVLFHEPPAIGRWQAHSMESDAHGGRGGDVLAAIREGGVSAVFLGHIHLYDEMALDGIPYIISGGGGAPLSGKLGFGSPEHGFVAVHIARNKVTWDWVPSDG